MSPLIPSHPATTLWLVARMLTWSLTLPVLKRTVPLPRLARLMSASRAGPRDMTGERRVIVWARRVDRLRPRRFRNNCLDRSMLAYRFLGKTGSDPRLVVGFESGADGIAGHAWVVVDETPLYGDEGGSRFSEIIAFGRDGAMEQFRVGGADEAPAAS